MYKYLYGLLLFFAFTSAQSSNRYSEIQSLNMASLAWEDEEWPNEPFRDYLYRFFDYQLDMQKIKKRRTVFKLFAALEAEKPVQHNVLYDCITAQDLGLFAGKSPNDTYIAEIIDRTNTEFGKVYLYGLLGTPISDIEQLRNRQAIIKYAIAHEELLHALDDTYKKMAQSQNFILSLWQQDGFLNTTERRYFSIPLLIGFKKYLNSSPGMLEAKRLLGHQERMVWFGTGVTAIGLLSAYGICKCLKIAVPDLLERMAHRLQGTGGRLIALLSSIESVWFDAAAASFAGALSCAFSCKEDYEWVRDNMILDVLLQKKMIAIAKFFNAVTHLNELIQEHPKLIELCPAALRIHDFMNNHALQGSFYEFLELCKSSTLAESESFFSYHGKSLAAFKLVYECKDTIEPLLMALGELDAYISCAQLYNEFKDKRVQFCFVEYKQDTQPAITMNNFWNPMIDPEKVIANDIHLQGPDRRNMIITGPNAGGKSTLIKAVPINLILSQSIGIAAAHEAEITPFATIATYLNIVDDIAAGNSLFKAQVLRAQEMVNLVENTSSGEFSFVALDEMFNGTSANESMAAAYSVVNHMGKSENNICMVATHFPLLTQLESKSSAFQNYKVSVNVDETGIKYPFKLEKGISRQHVALDILKQEGYDCAILDEASSILRDVNAALH